MTSHSHRSSHDDQVGAGGGVRRAAAAAARRPERSRAHRAPGATAPIPDLDEDLPCPASLAADADAGAAADGRGAVRRHHSGGRRITECLRRSAWSISSTNGSVRRTTPAGRPKDDPVGPRLARRGVARRFKASFAGSTQAQKRRSAMTSATCREAKPQFADAALLRKLPRPDRGRLLLDARGHEGSQVRRQRAADELRRAAARSAAQGGPRRGAADMSANHGTCSAASRRRLRRQRLQRALPHAGVPRRARCRRARRLESEPGERRPPPRGARSSTSATRRPTRRSRDMVADPPSTRSGSRDRTTRASRTSRRSSTRSRAAGARCSGIACEKPLARNVAEAKRVARAREARRAHATATSRIRSSRRRSRPGAR